MQIIRKLVAACSMAAMAATAAATDYPSKPIRLIVPYPAGGLTDVMTRGIAQEVEKALGQTVVIENRGGANGTLGAAAMASASPDGYLLALAPGGVFRQPYIQKTAFDPLKLTYVTSLFDYSYVVAVRGDSPWKTMADMVATVQAKPDTLAYGSPGVFSTPHLVMDALGRMKGLTWAHIPYKGGADTVNALMGGQVDAIIGGASGTLASLVKDGRIRVIATMGENRTTDYPQAPTLKESGFALSAVAPIGVVAPSGMDPAVVAKIDRAFSAALNSTRVRDMSKQYGMPIVYLNPRDYTAYAQKTSATEKERMERLLAEGVRP